MIKSILIISFLFLLSLGLSAQGNSLEFNPAISYDGNQSYGEYTRLPIWLPEGTGVFEISILEFNVVPN